MSAIPNLDDLDQAPADPGEAPDSWRPIDLGPYLRGGVKRAEPTIGLFRTDGLRLLYRGKEHAVVGEMESGKGWLGLACALAEMAVGNHVVYCHFEECDPSDTVERLLALGATEKQILELFRFVGPWQRLGPGSLALLLDPLPSLAIFDGVNEAMSLHGWGIRDEDGAAAFRRHLVVPCNAVGVATLAQDHVVKDVERRGRNALGSIHKGNGLSGVLIMLENAEPFGRGQRGRSHVFVTKDRPGFLRQHGRPGKMSGKTFMGELVVDDQRMWTPELELKFWAPSDRADTTPEPQGDDVSALVLEAVRSLTGAGKVANLRAVFASVPLRKGGVSDALDRLVLADVLAEASGARGARVFTVPGDQLSEDAP